MNAPIASTAALTLCELADTGLAGLESHSPFCLKAHRALRASGLSYARRHGEQPATFKHLNPAGQVPVLLVGERRIPDSTEILRWLAEQGRIEAPPEAWLWEELGDTSLSGFVVASRWLDEENWPRARAVFFERMPAPLRLFVPGLVRRRIRRGLIAREHWRVIPPPTPAASPCPGPIDRGHVRSRPRFPDLVSRRPAERPPAGGPSCRPPV